MCVCLGFVHGAEISAGRSPLMVEDLLWGKLGLLSLKPQVVAGSVLHDTTGLYGLFGSSVMGTVFCMAFTKNALLRCTLQLLLSQAGKMSLWVENIRSGEKLTLQSLWRIQQPCLAHL